MNYYNDNDPKACAWLRELIAAGEIAPGHVDERSILEIKPDDLAGFDQCHFFAGIGGWALALRWAGLEGVAGIWSGSCPCQPLSCAGQRKGHADERHLWPAFHDLIAKRRPATVFGEQVASKDGREWFAGVRLDLEGLGYACGGADLCAAGVGAPHRRQRLFWVADANMPGCDGRARGGQQPICDEDLRPDAVAETGHDGQQHETKRQGGATMTDVARLAAWPTPQTEDSGESQTARKGGENLAVIAAWATPRAEDAESAGMRHSRGVADTPTAQAGQGATSCPAGTGKRGVLRPGHSRWLMGYPAAWDSCGATAMQSCRKSRRSS